MFNFGGGEMFFVVLLVLLLFGPSQLPKMARGFGQAIKEFKKAQREINDEIQREDPPQSTTRPPDNKPLS